MKKSFNSSRGVTLFIAVTIMAILLFVSFAIINIAVKSTLFASSAKDSELAFFAADAGVECAIFWDTKNSQSQFATSTDGSPINCSAYSISTGNSISGTTTLSRIGGGGNSNPTSVFGFVMDQGSDPSPYCVIVTVTKYYSGSKPKTYIKSRGYNTCSDSNRRIERGEEVTY